MNNIKLSTKNTFIQGTFFTFMTSHNEANLEGQKLDCMSVDFHGRPSSLNRFMEGKGRARDGFSDEVS